MDTGIRSLACIYFAAAAVITNKLNIMFHLK